MVRLQRLRGRGDLLFQFSLQKTTLPHRPLDQIEKIKTYVMKTLKILGLIFGFIGILLWGIAVIVISKTHAFLEVSELTMGTVVGFEEKRSTSDASNVMLKYAIIRWTDDSGNEHQFTSSFGSTAPRKKIGETVEVRFVPQQPERVKVDSFFSNWMAVIVLIGVGLLFAIAGGVIWGLVLMQFRRTHLLAGSGRPVSATYDRVEMDKNTTINGQNPWRIYCKWRDPVSNQEIEFRSPAMLFDPTPYIPNKRLNITVAPMNPKHYEMDLSFIPDGLKSKIVKL